MVKNIALSLLLLICSATLFAQRDKDIKRGYSVVGQIVDKSDNQGIPYATIRVLDRKNVVVSVGTADVLGEFKLSLRSPGNYLLKFDAMSYGSDSLSVEVKLGTNEIGIIKLSEGHQLAGVTVTAEKLVMRQELEKLIYDVTKDPDAKRLKMADIMEKIPFMKIDGTDGKLKYLEDRVPTILIDGKPHPMISSQRQFPMRMIKGDVMKDIEIILPHTSENPTDKPIININLEKALPDGFVTEIRTSGNTLKSYRGSIDFISKFDKLYLSFRYSHHGQKRPERALLTTKENLLESAPIYRQENSSINWGRESSHSLSAGASYQIGKKDYVGLTLSADKQNSTNESKSSSKNYNSIEQLLLDQHSKTTGKSTGVPRLNSIINYNHGIKDGTIALSYGLSSHLGTNSHLYHIFTGQSITPLFTSDNSSRTSSTDHSGSLSYYQRINGKHRLEAGAIYSHREYFNFSQVEYWDYENNQEGEYTSIEEGLSYTQQVFRVRSRFAYIKGSLIATASLSVEQMNNRGVFHIAEGIDEELNYNEINLFPVLGVTYRTKKRTRYGLFYQTRTLRPNITYLNPYIDDSDPQNISMGNPNLKSEYAHSFRATTGKMLSNSFSYNFGVAVEYTKGAIERVTNIDDKGVSVTTFKNLSRKESYLANTSLAYRPYKWVSLSIRGNINHFIYSSKERDVESSSLGFGLYGGAFFRMGKFTSAGIAYNRSPQLGSAQTKEVKYFSSFLVDLAQTLVKDKLFLTLSLREPFKKSHYRSNVIGNDHFIMTTNQQVLGRVFTFYLTWNFGRLKDRGTFPEEFKRDDLTRPDLLP